MKLLYPTEQGPDQLEGIEAHDYALHGVVKGEITADMQRGRDLVLEYLKDKEPHVERYLHAIDIDDTCKGMPDFWTYQPDKRICHMMEFKYGHRFVDEFLNWQMLCYASVAIRKCLVEKFVFTVIQPRNYIAPHVRSWECSPTFAAGLFLKLKEAALEARRPLPPVVVGSHCETCNGRHVCMALSNQAASATVAVNCSLPIEISLDAASRELEVLQRYQSIIKARVEGLEEMILTKLRCGEVSPRYAIGSGNSTLYWKKPMSDMLREYPQLRKDDIVTPKQSVDRKLFSAKEMAELTERRVGAGKLIKLDPERAFQNG